MTSGVREGAGHAVGGGWSPAVLLVMDPSCYTASTARRDTAWLGMQSVVLWWDLRPASQEGTHG